jgi:adenosylmethionine-8-amino-7-oxononanoate aminotransferase
LLRPLGNVIYFMPPYVIEDEHITRLIEVALEGLEQAVR